MIRVVSPATGISRPGVPQNIGGMQSPDLKASLLSSAEYGVGVAQQRTSEQVFTKVVSELGEFACRAGPADLNPDVGMSADR